MVASASHKVSLWCELGVPPLTSRQHHTPTPALLRHVSCLVFSVVFTLRRLCSVSDGSSRKGLPAARRSLFSCFLTANNLLKASVMMFLFFLSLSWFYFLLPPNRQLSILILFFFPVVSCLPGFSPVSLTQVTTCSWWRSTSWVTRWVWSTPTIPVPSWLHSTSTWTPTTSSCRWTTCRAFRKSTVRRFIHSFHLSLQQTIFCTVQTFAVLNFFPMRLIPVWEGLHAAALLTQ